MVPGSARLVSRYGERPSRRDGSPHFHAGTDISTGERGSPVFAVKEGTVELVSDEMSPGGMTGYGNAVVIRHGNKFTLYAHLTRALVTAGQSVAAGQQIGIMGNTTNGQFSPHPGQDPEEWAREARSRGYRSGPMAVHLHLEVRRQRPDGGSPFPGPYPRAAEDALFNVDPQDWLREHGMIFTRRGGIEIQPGGAADRSRPDWEPRIAAATAGGGRAVAGLGALSPTATPSRAAIAPLPGGYEPVEFERDPKWGLSPVEWSLLGAGSMVGVASIFAFLLRRRPMASNKRGPRKNRLRRWGEK